MEEQTIRIHCNSCSKKINHSVLATVDVNGEEGEAYWTDTYQTLKCGCGNVTFRIKNWHSELQDGDPDSEPFYICTYYPPPFLRIKPKWFSQLDEKLVDVLDEVYSALQHDLRYIAAVGIRTALDILLVDKVADLKNNKDKYNALIEKGFATKDQLEMIKAVIDIGDAAAHRGYKPKAKDLNHVMDLAETIIEKIYITGKREEQLLVKAKELKLNVPQRYTQA